MNFWLLLATGAGYLLALAMLVLARVGAAHADGYHDIVIEEREKRDAVLRENDMARTRLEGMAEERDNALADRRSQRTNNGVASRARRHALRGQDAWASDAREESRE